MQAVWLEDIKMGNKSTFVKITNKDIYDKLLEIEEHVVRTNGKVKLNRWIATTAITLAMLAIGFALKSL